LSAPIEHIRIRLQTNATSNLGPMKLIKDISSQHGWRANWKGFGVTATREIGYGVYFVTYELALRGFIPKGKSVNDVHPVWLMLCGALGGAGMWSTC